MKYIPDISAISEKLCGDHFLGVIERSTKWNATAVLAATATPATTSAKRTPTVTPRTAAAVTANATSVDTGRGPLIAEPLSKMTHLLAEIITCRENGVLAPARSSHPRLLDARSFGAGTESAKFELVFEWSVCGKFARIQESGVGLGCGSNCLSGHLPDAGQCVGELFEQCRPAAPQPGQSASFEVVAVDDV